MPTIQPRAWLARAPICLYQYMYNSKGTLMTILCITAVQVLTQFQLNGHVFVIQYFMDLFYETGFVQPYQIKIQGLFKDNFFFCKD